MKIGGLNRRLKDNTSGGRFTRRLHRCAHLLEPLFEILADLGRELNAENLYVIDSFPVAACDNYGAAATRVRAGAATRPASGATSTA